MLFAWAPAAAAVLVAVVADHDWSIVLRVVVTAVVYAPVAAIVLSVGRRWIGVIVGALAISSGWLALVVVISELPGTRPGIDPVLFTLLAAARQPEIAALAILPWLLVRARGPLWHLGVGIGMSAIAVDLSWWALRAAGVDAGHQAVSLAMALLGFLCAAVAIARQWRHGPPDRREALAWFGLGAVLMTLSYVRVLGLGAGLVADAIFVLAQGLLPAGIIAASMRGHIHGSVRWLVASMVWIQALAFAISLYLIVGALLSRLGAPGWMAGAGAASALALVFGSMLGFVRRRTTRLYLGPGADARVVLERLGERISVAGGSSPGTGGLAESLRAVWGLSSVTIRTSAEDGTRAGRGGRFAITQQLHSGGRTVGSIELTGDDAGILDHIVAPLVRRIDPLIAVAVLLDASNREVATMRRRTLGVRYEERRMLHRELRDDLAPSLAGIGYGMAAARRRIADRPAEAGPVVAELRRDVAERAEVVRRLARSMLPPALDAGDLDGALTDLARRFSDDDVTVTLRAAGADVAESHTQIGVYLLLAEVVSRARRSPEVRGIALQVRPRVHDLLVTVDLGEGACEPAIWTALTLAVDRHAADIGGTVTETAAGRSLVIVVPR